MTTVTDAGRAWLIVVEPVPCWEYRSVAGSATTWVGLGVGVVAAGVVLLPAFPVKL